MNHSTDPSSFRAWIALIVLLTSFFLVQSAGYAQSPPIYEASGVCVQGDSLVIVGDESDGEYHKYAYKPGSLPKKIVLDQSSRYQEHRIMKARLPLDLEGVGVLADGSLVFLSEQLKALLVHDGAIMSYPEKCSEFGNRGLEGLAVRPSASTRGASDVATLWEGGYPDRFDLLEVKPDSWADIAFSPVVFHHTFDTSNVSGPLSTTILDMSSLRSWIAKRYPDDKEPHVFRFRAPDIVWHDSIWIVLLSATRTPFPEKDRFGPYGPKLLQRFDFHGNAIGAPYDLKDVLEECGSTPNRNWEGLSWYERGASLILTHDSHRPPAEVVVIQLPGHW